jgi:cysteine desulfurase
VLAHLAANQDLWPWERLLHLRSAFWQRLALIPEIQRWTPELGSFPSVLCVSVPDVPARALLARLDSMGVAASAGSACAAGGMEPSHVLLAMGVPAASAAGAVRFSFCAEQSAEELEMAADRVGQAVEFLRLARGR